MTISISTATWHWQQWALVGIWVFRLSAMAFMHGKPREGEHNVGIILVATLIQAYLLVSGGFFD